MNSKTSLLLELWIESRTRFTNQLDALTEGGLFPILHIPRGRWRLSENTESLHQTINFVE
jgi:hypothetical protein